MPASTSRFAALDGLRFLAASAVMMFHYTALTEDQVDRFGHLAPYTIYGAFGVHLFFMISGFVILMTAWGTDVPNFVASRIGRLFPAYWAAVLITGGVLVAFRPDAWEYDPDTIGVKTILLNLTMSQTAVGAPHVDGVYWTLWIELLFYVIMGLMLCWGLTRQRVLALVFLWPILAQVADTAKVPMLQTLLVPRYAPLFCLGMVAYLMHRYRPSTALWLALALNLGLVAHLSQSVYAPTVDRFDDPKPSSTIVFAIIVVGLGVLVLIACTRLGRVRWRPLTLLGLLTYPLYLLHENLGFWVQDLLLERGGLSDGHALTLVVGLMMALAALVNVVVERPFGPRLRLSLRGDLLRDGRVEPSKHRGPGRPGSGAHAADRR